MFETDEFKPLIELGEELSGKRYGETFATDRALRILADHTRGMSFLIADGVVPSNEDRGYVLRRVMRRAIVQGRRLGIEPGFLPRFAAVVRELMGGAYPELREQADTIDMWLRNEEEAFNRTLDQGMRLLDDIIARAREAGEEGIGSDQAFLLHDTYGFPFELTLELAAEQGLGVDEEGFERRMEQQRERARGGGRGARDADRDRIHAFAERAGYPTTFTGYETTEQATQVSALSTDDGRTLAKLVESPFYATGGGQIADAGVIECEDGDCSARVVDVIRVGDDQALVLEPLTGELAEGERVIARVDPSRHLTERNHTATHLMHAALRDTLGSHVRQAGSYVGPDKLRFDFTHGSPLTEDELREVEDAVNRAIVADSPVRALTTTLDEARALGAMALFGEKYGDVVRMVEVGDGNWSRELCGGTHVRSTGVIGAFKITAETSSAANVRRIEAVTSQAAIEDLRRSDRLLTETARVLRTSPESVPDVAADRERKRRELEKRGAAAAPVDDRVDADKVFEFDGVKVLLDIKQVDNPKALPDLADRLKNQLGDPAVVVLGARGDGRANLLVAATPGAVERGVQRRRRGQGGRPPRRRRRRRARHHGPGGRARAGEAPGRPEGGARGDRARPRRVRVLALDYGSARCGAAVSDPTGTLATPLEPVLRPGTRKGLRRIVQLVDELGARARHRRPAGLPVGRRLPPDARDAGVRRAAARRRERPGRALRRALHDLARAAGGG